MLQHRKTQNWEHSLKKLFDEIDDYLETRYGNTFPLHPTRAKRNTTASKEQDGLFDVGASFSAGLGSEYGEGYVVEIRFATLSVIPDDFREKIGEEVAVLIREKLPVFFPGINLDVARDGNVYKIFGDLSLGQL